MKLLRVKIPLLILQYKTTAYYCRCWLLAVFCMFALVGTSQTLTPTLLLDTAAIKKQIEKGAAIAEQSPQQAFQLLSESLAASNKIAFDRGIALSSTKLGRWYFGNDIEKAIRSEEHTSELQSP